MSHSVETHRRNYEMLKGPQHAAAAHKTIRNLVREDGRLEKDDSVGEMKRKIDAFTSEETSAIEEWFREFIEEG